MVASTRVADGPLSAAGIEDAAALADTMGIAVVACANIDIEATQREATIPWDVHSRM